MNQVPLSKEYVQSFSVKSVMDLCLPPGEKGDGKCDPSAGQIHLPLLNNVIFVYIIVFVYFIIAKDVSASCGFYTRDDDITVIILVYYKY